MHILSPYLQIIKDTNLMDIKPDFWDMFASAITSSNTEYIYDLSIITDIIDKYESNIKYWQSKIGNQGLSSLEKFVESLIIMREHKLITNSMFIEHVPKLLIGCRYYLHALLDTHVVLNNRPDKQKFLLNNLKYTYENIELYNEKTNWINKTKWYAEWDIPSVAHLTAVCYVMSIIDQLLISNKQIDINTNISLLRFIPTLTNNDHASTITTVDEPTLKISIYCLDILKQYYPDVFNIVEPLRSLSENGVLGDYTTFINAYKKEPLTETPLFELPTY